MQERLFQYFTKHSGLFLSNSRQALTGFDADAIHDMRVAVKRIRAVYLLLERLFPDTFNSVSEEGRLKELFRFSGRMRDIQVQKLLLESYSANLDTTFGDYKSYLEDSEKKAVKKFRKLLQEFSAEEYVKHKLKLVEGLIALTAGEQVRKQIIGFVDELMEAAKEMRIDQEHDENLHEIRRKLKQCHYLLSVFDPEDPDLPTLNKTIRHLDHVNELLGDWHDQVVAMEMLDRFLEKHIEKEITGNNRYVLLRENLSVNRHLLYIKILSYIEVKLSF
ncbi:MAG: CHAD domain-containing protein [Bacteroidota bacterium]